MQDASRSSGSAGSVETGGEARSGWLSAVVHNLYGHPEQMAPPSSLVGRGGYRRARDVIVARRLQQPVVTTIKLAHTAIFALLMSLVVSVALAGIRDRLTRRTLAALLFVVAEAAVVTLNGGGCPLTSVVEDLGAEHGSVSDIFLPDWFARRIPHISTALLLLGMTALAARRLARLARPA